MYASIPRSARADRPASHGRSIIARLRPAKDTWLTLLLCIALTAGSATSRAATSWFVDSALGNDTNSGTAATVSAGGVGPWRSLTRLAAAQIAPGDTVYLACGSIWNEALRVGSSGSASSPITITAGPGPCSVPPTIDGDLAIPGHMWTQHSGSIYRARLPVQLISNSRPASGITGWTHWSAAGNSTLFADAACPGGPCMSIDSGTTTSLVISNGFAISQGVDYVVATTLRAPLGARLRVVVRRGGPTYEPWSDYLTVTGTGQWQTVGFSFRPVATVGNARLDIEVPPAGVRVNIREAAVRRNPAPSAVRSLHVDGISLRPAHHPNFSGADASSASPFAIATGGSTTTLDLSTAPLPAGAQVTAGLGVSVKPYPYFLEERRITNVTGGRITLDPPLSFQARAGTPYFLRGALWMLDSPGEWHFDATTGDLYVWMPDASHPGARVTIATLARAIDLGGRSHVHVAGLRLRRAETGASLTRSQFVTLRNLAIEDMTDHGVEADNCAACSLDRSSVRRTGLDAIRAIGALTTGFTLRESTVAESGVSERTDGWRSLPRPSRAAVDVGAYASIVDNDILATSNSGIYAGIYSSIRSNRVHRTCLVFNDCGGVYVNYFGNQSVIEGNVIHDVIGGMAGLPTSAPNQAVGIYLDNGASAVEVRGNTVTGAEFGLQVHNAEYATIDSNLFFGNRRYQLWMQEQTRVRRANGDVHSNRVDRNTLVPTSGGPSVVLESELGDTRDFASFLANRYSALISQRPVTETVPTGSNSHTLSEWMASGQDAGASQTLPTGYASFLVQGGSMVPNGGLAAGLHGWTWWNQTAPLAQVAVFPCSFGPCLRVTAGASPTLLSSPNFSVTEGQWYRVSFDAATSQAAQPINVLVRRGGGGSATYEPVMPTSESFAGTTTWRRYAFLFRATRTVIANDPRTGELGARIDFERIQPGTQLTVARVEMVPLQPVQAALQLRLLLNPTRAPLSLSCPPSDAAAGLCTKFVYFRDGTPVSWPATVPALTGDAVYTRDTSLVDTDFDGIADVQDACPATAAGQAVDSRGCSFAP